MPEIALVTDIAVHNPRTYAVAAAIISKLICDINVDRRRGILKHIKTRFDRVCNTGHLQLWLQRLSYHHGNAITYSEPLCCLIKDNNTKIWNNE